ncbi:hypothetical protein I204_08356 [Kwoniella mangroviensis CBS 8886]|nr:hypothetical protein I204_08356 [Kwoniella mangroviensis CBS 8886]
MIDSPIVNSSSGSRSALDEVPHEFRGYQLRHKPFASHPPASGWKEGDEPGTFRLKQDYTLIFVVDRQKGKVLLGYKRRGMGVDLYNGFGGKVEDGEEIHQCAARELEEESGLRPKPGGLYYKGCLISARPQSAKLNSPACIIKIHFLACVAWFGLPIPTEEMIPEWFDISEGLPVHQMWPEASFYLLPVLQSIQDDQREDLFLSRIDYEYMRLSDAPTSLPALDGSTVRRSRPWQDEEEPDFGECLSGWWMCFASSRGQISG